MLSRAKNLFDRYPSTFKITVAGLLFSFSDVVCQLRISTFNS